MDKAFKSRVRRTGQKLFQLMGDEVPPLFHKESWTVKVLAQCVKDEGFKTDFLRFMDVLPSLKQADFVAEHLVDTFGRPQQPLPMELKLHFTRVSPASLKRAESVSKELQEMMNRFIAAAAPAEALPVLTGIRDRGMGFSVGLLGEAVVSEAEADAHAERYLDMMDDLGLAQEGWKPLGDSRNPLDWGIAAKVNFSVKPSSTYSQMSARAFDHSISKAKERLRPVLRTSRAERDPLEVRGRRLEDRPFGP